MKVLTDVIGNVAVVDEINDDKGRKQRGNYFCYPNSYRVDNLIF